VLYAPPKIKFMKMSLGSGIISTFVTAVIIATLGIFVFRVFVQRVIDRTFGGILAGITNAISIMLFGMAYRTVAKRLTDWENHRTESDYENHLILKNFVFQFVNSYVSLFYIAFIKGKMQLFGMDTEQCAPDCMTELSIQLGTIFITSTSVQQLNEVGIPWIKQKLAIYMESRKIQKVTKSVAEAPPQAEAEAKCSPYPSTFDDYNEMAIQFGYLTLFAVAFPAAPLAALINNLVEGRSDLLKLLKGMQRPHPKEAANIGTWLEIIEMVSYLATVTNCAIIVFTSTELDNSYNMNIYTKLWIGILAEHLIFLLKFAIEKFIPDSPEWVRESYARRVYYKQVALELSKKNDDLKVRPKEQKPEQQRTSTLVSLED